MRPNLLRPAAGVAPLALAAAIAFAFASVMPATRAARADRMAPLPLEIRVAAADVVIVGKIADLAPVPVRSAPAYWAPDTVATVEAERVLGGTLGEKRPTIGWRASPRHATFHPSTGGRLVFLLRRPLPGEGRWGLVDDLDGAFEASKADVERAEAIARGDRPRWRDNPSGLRAMLVSERRSFAGGDNVDLFLLVQNLGPAPVKTARTEWPRATMTRTALRMAGKSGVVEPKPVPIAEADIASYFDKRTPWESEIAPGRFMELRLGRVTTAAPGWGYKEELGFVYYPAKLGTYDVSATLHNLVRGAPAIETGPLHIELR